MRQRNFRRLAFVIGLPLLTGLLVSAVRSNPPDDKLLEPPQGTVKHAVGETGLGTPESVDPAVTDSLYNAHHPRLLYTPDEIPELYAKVRDGGADDAAYSFIRILVQYIYAGSSPDQILNDNYGLSAIPNLGVGSVLQSPPDLSARDKGRDLCLYVADNWGPTSDAYYSALRLRALALGYDMFFEASDESERGYVRDEIRAYMDMMMNHDDYEVWLYRPYLANISAMVAASLGLAAICLDGETGSAAVEDALAHADLIIRTWLTYQVDEEGAYNEGALYGSWSLRHLVYYFWARARYDGYDYAADKKIRNMEKWFAYELHPDGGGKVNNIQDCSYLESPLSQSTTFFDWAKTAWGSGLSAYIWDHVAGVYGYNAGENADKAGTVIWHRNIAPEQPESVLPESMAWENRGLYYFRTGWPSGASSGDVLFSFYSGKFQGGHAQEDQNQFTLYAYGAPFAVDHGVGSLPRQSEAHNMILIDGNGQHTAGSSIGTDGELTRYLINSFSDYLMGDATDAYTTHSPVNNIGFPFPWSDWSWGYTGANPVHHAIRSFFVVRDPETPPYFILIDDIQKDDLPHTYEWRLHTGRNNVIDTSVNPIHISYGDAFMDLHVMEPPYGSLQKTVTYFNNLVPDPDSNVLSLTTTAVDPVFAFVLIPGDASTPTPTVTSTSEAWGLAVSIEWPSGKTDLLLVNRSGGVITFTPSGPQTTTRLRVVPVGGGFEASQGLIETDADVALVRLDGTAVEKYIVADASTFAAEGTTYATIANGTATIGFSGTEINIDRYDAVFTLYAPGVSDMFYRGQRIYVVENDGFLTRDPVVSIAAERGRSPGLRVHAYPNPFNPVSVIAVEVDTPGLVTLAVYDVKGRLVKKLWNGPLPAGVRMFRWGGESETGKPVASGVYFLSAGGGRRNTTLKITLVR